MAADAPDAQGDVVAAVAAAALPPAKISKGSTKWIIVPEN